MNKYLYIFPVWLLIMACGKPASPSKEKNREYVIAYNVLTDEKTGNFDVFVIHTDGSGKHNLLPHEDMAWAFHASGKNLYFISDRDTLRRHYFLYQTDATGNHVQKITDLRVEDSWLGSRNNGEELVVSGRIGKEWRYQLFIVNTKTGDYRQITHDSNTYFRDPCFSPDGKHIVASVLKNRKNKNAHEELYLMNDDGSGIIQLTHYPENDSLADRYSYKAGPPRWNAKENFISYQSHQNGKYSLFAVTPDGKKQWKLTDHMQEEGWHDWSPDGKWLAVEMSDKKHQQFDIYLMNWETKEVMRLTDTTYRFQQAPVFLEK